MFPTNRIHLRKVTEKDEESYHSWRNDMEVMEYTNPYFDLYTFEETESFIESIRNAPSSKSYIIELIEGKHPIRIVSLINIDYKNCNAEGVIDTGNKDYWGNGYGEEAMTLLLN